MEYYILKLYEEEQVKCVDLKQGIHRFEKKVRICCIVCLIIMLLGCLATLITYFWIPKQPWCLIGLFLYLIAALILFFIEGRDKRMHMDRYVDLHKMKLEVLDKVLAAELQGNSREKIEELIGIYETSIERTNHEETKRNRIILTIFSVFAGVSTISFENMSSIGIDFGDWLYIITMLLIFVVAANLWIYSYKFFDTSKGKYEMMIKDLKDLLLLKYQK